MFADVMYSLLISFLSHPGVVKAVEKRVPNCACVFCLLC